MLSALPLKELQQFRHLGVSVFFPELVKVCYFLLVRFDIRNLDESAWAENEHLAFGFELCKFVKCLVVADMARGNRFDKFGVMAVGEFYKREPFLSICSNGML